MAGFRKPARPLSLTLTLPPPPRGPPRDAEINYLRIPCSSQGLQRFDSIREGDLPWPVSAHLGFPRSARTRASDPKPRPEPTSRRRPRGLGAPGERVRGFAEHGGGVDMLWRGVCCGFVVLFGAERFSDIRFVWLDGECGSSDSAWEGGNGHDGCRCSFAWGFWLRDSY